MSKKVISFKNQPTTVPIQFAILSWLVLDRVHANELTWGIVGTLVVLLLIVTVVRTFTQEQVDIFTAKGNTQENQND